MQVFCSFRKAEEMFSVTTRTGGAATWHNWLSDVHWSAISVFSHWAHCRIQFRDEPPWHSRVVWQNSEKLIPWSPLSLSLPKLVFPFSSFSSFFNDERVTLRWLKSGEITCVWVPFSRASITALDIYESVYSIIFLTFCCGNWWNMMGDLIVMECWVGHLEWTTAP